ncbi:M48 family metallopeptidase [Spiribacter halobius]|uniref:Peptidase n=1 Tax=Sediminicurvatus halobius TaxID=2182432 RepID=A0A2U2MVW6_9GAMM|nr:M48 family metallopeptidase [Spiribacter halobius]PWG61000.1 peptidase [Spiribacter halobius]PWG64143.1 peptidase [Spiribacter halobius]UEX78736.1 M48 family metallopeptidase [Spiribacter halobius]
MLRRLSTLAVAALLAAACATSPTGRQQLQLFPASQLEEMGVQAYRQMREEEPVLEEGPAVTYVQCVTDALLPQVPERYARDDWEVTVFDSEQINAFALPGGKIGVYTGLLEVAETPAQLATVIGHEIGHVMAEHGNERMSTQMATVAGLTALQIMAGGSRERQQALAVLGLGAQVGIILPFSRLHESEADQIGLELMARAGFDPRESVQLWRNMAEAGGDGPPEFLSTHPSKDTRIRDLEAQMDGALGLYRQAQARGRDPDCRPPRG